MLERVISFLLCSFCTFNAQVPSHMNTHTQAETNTRRHTSKLRHAHTHRHTDTHMYAKSERVMANPQGPVSSPTNEQWLAKEIGRPSHWGKCRPITHHWIHGWVFILFNFQNSVQQSIFGSMYKGSGRHAFTLVPPESYSFTRNKGK